jgi:hypothetical protein
MTQPVDRIRVAMQRMAKVVESFRAGASAPVT